MEKQHKLPVAPVQSPEKAIKALLGDDFFGERAREVSDAYTVGYAQGLMERPGVRRLMLTGAFFGAIAGAAVTAAVVLLR